MKLRVNGVVKESVVDGPGFRYVIFCQGCLLDCAGCHNPEAQPLDGGRLIDIAQILQELNENPLLSGVTLSGGEPFLQAAPLALLADSIKKQFPQFTLYTYSGYTLEQLQEKAQKDADIKRLLQATDVLVDGPFVKSLQDSSLRFRGSSNQRIIDMSEISL